MNIMTDLSTIFSLPFSPSLPPLSTIPLSNHRKDGIWARFTYEFVALTVKNVMGIQRSSSLSWMMIIIVVLFCHHRNNLRQRKVGSDGRWERRAGEEEVDLSALLSSAPWVRIIRRSNLEIASPGYPFGRRGHPPSDGGKREVEKRGKVVVADVNSGKNLKWLMIHFTPNKNSKPLLHHPHQKQGEMDENIPTNVNIKI